MDRLKKILKIYFLILAILVISGCMSTDHNIQSTNMVRLNNTTVKIDIRGLIYVPMIITISNGTTVSWTNRDSIQHTVTSINIFDSGYINPDMFDSGAINTDSTYSHTFNQTGAFEYSCTIHRDMPHGLVIVRK
jgi:plastocyanin